LDRDRQRLGVLGGSSFQFESLSLLAHLLTSSTFRLIKKWKVRTSASECSGAPLPGRLACGTHGSSWPLSTFEAGVSLRLPGKGLQPKQRPIDNEQTVHTERLSIVRDSA